MDFAGGQRQDLNDAYARPPPNAAQVGGVRARVERSEDRRLEGVVRGISCSLDLVRLREITPDGDIVFEVIAEDPDPFLAVGTGWSIYRAEREPLFD